MASSLFLAPLGMAMLSAQIRVPSLGTQNWISGLSKLQKEASPLHIWAIQASSAIIFCLLFSVSYASTLVFSFFRSLKAASTSFASVLLLDLPSFFRARLNTSRLSFSRMMWPLYSGFHRSAQLVMGSFTYFLL